MIGLTRYTPLPLLRWVDYRHGVIPVACFSDIRILLSDTNINLHPYYLQLVIKCKSIYI
jgi:hypothetical protein